jgi:hypothetical protein
MKAAAPAAAVAVSEPARKRLGPGPRPVQPWVAPLDPLVRVADRSTRAAAARSSSSTRAADPGGGPAARRPEPSRTPVRWSICIRVAALAPDPRLVAEPTWGIDRPASRPCRTGPWPGATRPEGSPTARYRIRSGLGRPGHALPLPTGRSSAHPVRAGDRRPPQRAAPVRQEHLLEPRAPVLGWPDRPGPRWPGLPAPMHPG